MNNQQQPILEDLSLTKLIEINGGSEFSEDVVESIGFFFGAIWKSIESFGGNSRGAVRFSIL